MFKLAEFPPSAPVKKPEKRGEAMDQMLGVIASRLNSDFAPFLDDKQKGPIVDQTCSISPDCFAVASGGPYSRVDDVKTDKRFVKAKQLEWSEAEDSNVAKFYAQKYGCNTTEEIVAQWIENKEQHVSMQLEKAITAIFYKIIGSKFLVMRASTYDDYANRVDNVIVDRATGDVVCTFDEVHDAGKGDRRAEKEEK